MCVPILTEERTVVIKDHSLKTYTWTGWSGKIATWQKHKNVVKPKLNTVILTQYCSHLETKSCPFCMVADDYCLVFCTHSSFWKCWKLSGKTIKMLDQKKSIIHGQRASGGVVPGGKLRIMWLLLSKAYIPTLEAPRQCM